MEQTMFKAMLLALPLAIAVPAIASPPADGDASDPSAEPSEAEALADDILLLIDLPVAADEARTAGIEEAEIAEALTAAEQAGVPASEMTTLIDEELKQIEARGKRKAFGQWVKLQIAEGKRGKALAEALEDRKDELAVLSDEEQAELDAKLEAIGHKQRELRKALHEKRKQLREQGKSVVLAGKDRHERMMAKANERHAEAKRKWKQAHKHEHGQPRDLIDERRGKSDGPHGAAAEPEQLDQQDERLDEGREQQPDPRDKRDEREKQLKERKAKPDNHVHHGDLDRPGIAGKKTGGAP